MWFFRRQLTDQRFIYIEIFVELTQDMSHKRTRWIIEYTEVQQREKEFHQPMKSGRWRGELE